MRQAATDLWFYVQSVYDNVPSARFYWPDRHYMSIMQTDDNRTFTWEYDDRIETIARACQYAWCTYLPKVLSKTPATDYQCAMADKDGKPLQPGKLYKVTVPADMPVKQFWALTVYDRATFAFIYSESERTTLSSYDLGTMKKAADGSFTIYVGPKAPSGLEWNWIPTSGKRPLPIVRFYGPTEAYYNKIFKMPDFELVD